jgi:hypothetical protein
VTRRPEPSVRPLRPGKGRYHVNNRRPSTKPQALRRALKSAAMSGDLTKYNAAKKAFSVTHRLRNTCAEGAICPIERLRRLPQSAAAEPGA